MIHSILLNIVIPKVFVCVEIAIRTSIQMSRAFILLSCYRIALSQLSEMSSDSMKECVQEWGTQVSGLRYPIDKADQFNKRMEKHVEDYRDQIKTLLTPTTSTYRNPLTTIVARCTIIWANISDLEYVWWLDTFDVPDTIVPPET